MVGNDAMSTAPIEHLLNRVSSTGDRAKELTFRWRAQNSQHDVQHEFHFLPLFNRLIRAWPSGFKLAGSGQKSLIS